MIMLIGVEQFYRPKSRCYQDPRFGLLSYQILKYGYPNSEILSQL